MKTSKLVVSFLVLVSMILGVASTSFAVSDRRIEREAINTMFIGFERMNIKDVKKSSASIKNVLKKTRADGVQFVVLEALSHSRKHGDCICAVYMVFTADGKLINSRRHLVSVDEKDDMYHSLAIYKNLVKFFGVRSAFEVVSL